MSHAIPRPFHQLDVFSAQPLLGNPLAAVTHLQGLLAAQGPQALIQAGEVVTTGTVTDAHAVSPGQTWSTRLEGIGLPGLRVGFMG